MEDKYSRLNRALKRDVRRLKFFLSIEIARLQVLKLWLGIKSFYLRVVS